MKGLGKYELIQGSFEHKHGNGNDNEFILRENSLYNTNLENWLWIISMNLQILHNNFLFLRLNNASNLTVFWFWQKYFGISFFYGFISVSLQ